MVMRYAKSCNHLFMVNHAIGTAITVATATNFAKLFANKIVTDVTEAPNTLRMPISFVRCAVANITKPNKPRHAIINASTVNASDNCSCFCSAAYCFAKFSSRK